MSPEFSLRAWILISVEDLLADARESLYENNPAEAKQTIQSAIGKLQNLMDHF